IVAAATSAHDELTRLAVARGIPVLVEKPLTSTEEQAEALRAAAHAAGGRVVMAHNSLYASGLDELFSTPPARAAGTYIHRRTPNSGDAMRTWGRAFFYEGIYHILAVAGRACGGGMGNVVQVSYRGDAHPERVRIELAYGGSLAEVMLDFTCAVEEDVL